MAAPGFRRERGSTASFPAGNGGFDAAMDGRADPGAVGFGQHCSRTLDRPDRGRYRGRSGRDRFGGSCTGPTLECAYLAVSWWNDLLARMAEDGKPSPGVRIVGIGFLLLAAVLLAGLILTGTITLSEQFGR